MVVIVDMRCAKQTNRGLETERCRYPGLFKSQARRVNRSRVFNETWRKVVERECSQPLYDHQNIFFFNVLPPSNVAARMWGWGRLVAEEIAGTLRLKPYFREIQRVGTCTVLFFSCTSNSGSL